VNSTSISSRLREKYLAEGSIQVERHTRTQGGARHGSTSISNQEYEIITCDLLGEDGVVRHDPEKLAARLLSFNDLQFRTRQDSAYNKQQADSPRPRPLV
jgi:hypothetical protein